MLDFSGVSLLKAITLNGPYILMESSTPKYKAGQKSRS